MNKGVRSIDAKLSDKSFTAMSVKDSKEACTGLFKVGNSSMCVFHSYWEKKGVKDIISILAFVA
jgi:hypothetical protein